MIMFDLLFLTRYNHEVNESLLFLLINSFIIYLSLAYPIYYPHARAPTGRIVRPANSLSIMAKAR
jgi:hypothetical protein